MVSISKISTMPIKTFAKTNVRNIAKTALPAVSALGILAGSSMSGYNPPFNVNPLPDGADVMNDSFSDILMYTGERAMNSASEMVDFVGDGVSDVAGKALDLISDALDFLG